MRSLESLARGIRRCRKCRLWEGRRHAVPGEGDPSARVMLVGEAPGEKEDHQGRPFVGMTGRRFLDDFLSEADFPRQELFITSAVKCRPPKNRNPLPDELMTCFEAWLRPQVEALEPEAIVLLGKIAVRQATGEDVKLAEAHGRIIELLGRRALMTYHPTAAMRFPVPRKGMREDFVKLRGLLEV